MTLEDKVDALTAKVDRLLERVEGPAQLTTVKEAALFTKLAERTIWRGIKAGKYRGYREGKAVRVNLKQMLEAMEQEATEALNRGEYPTCHTLNRSVRSV